ncbi:MAG TPA: cytochrome o ubiquinol oxidase subunit III [Candidatus Saccharimonadales bacterium]|nr:cytochrome o ubiquinol oxidase subunit III [Candidatus Saccharimonadales bacterium]
MNEETLAIDQTQPEVEMATQKRLEDRTMFGFWVYIMTDCVLFSVLFAVFAVLHNNTNGGAGARQLFSPAYALVETILLLTSSFTSGLALLSARRKDATFTVFWLLVTFALGTAFLGMELNEFHHLAADGNSWRASGFLSSFFTLVSTHGLHITAGLLWIVVLIANLVKRGFTPSVTRKLGLFAMFWHFLDVVWIFIFSIVYLMGAV